MQADLFVEPGLADWPMDSEMQALIWVKKCDQTMGNHSTTWPCLGGSKRVAYLVFCTSLGTPCDTGGWEYFDSNSIVFHSLQVKLWGDMGDGSGTLPDHLWRCTHLHFYSSVQVTWFFRFLTCEAHLKYWAFLAFLGHPCDRAGTSFQHGEAPGAVQSPSSARGDTTWWMDPRSLRNWDIRSWKGRMSGTCYWNMKKQIIGALFVERFTYTPAEVVSVLEISLDLKLPVEMQCWVKALWFVHAQAWLLSMACRAESDFYL